MAEYHRRRRTGLRILRREIATEQRAHAHYFEIAIRNLRPDHAYASFVAFDIGIPIEVSRDGLQRASLIAEGEEGTPGQRVVMPLANFALSNSDQPLGFGEWKRS